MLLAPGGGGGGGAYSRGSAKSIYGSTFIVNINDMEKSTIGIEFSLDKYASAFLT